MYGMLWEMARVRQREIEAWARGAPLRRHAASLRVRRGPSLRRRVAARVGGLLIVAGQRLKGATPTGGCAMRPEARV